MKEYKIKKSHIVRLMLTGIILVAAGFIIIQGSIQYRDFSLFTIVMGLITIFGLYTLSKPFMSYLKTDEKAIRVRDGLKKSHIVFFTDIENIGFDVLRMRVILFLNEGRRVSFEYIYEDLKEFVELLAQKGVNLRNHMGPM